MAILSQEEAKRLIDKVLSYSKADEMKVELNGGRTGNIRFARNSVSTAGATNNLTVSVTAVLGKRIGTSDINEFDEASLEKAVRRAEEMARLAPENPEYMPMPGPQTYTSPQAFVETTAGMKAPDRARLAGASIKSIMASQLSGAGFLDDSATFNAIGNSKGLFGYHKSTNANFSLTIRTPDGTGSGYAAGDFNDVSKLKTGALTDIAIQKARASQKAVALEPGKYTVILEPLAAGELIQFMMRAMDARTADEGRSFLSKKGGGTRLGEKLLDERVTIYSDPTDSQVPSSPFSGDGYPYEKVVWFDKGVVKNMSYSPYWAKQKGVKPLPEPSGFVMEGGTQSLADMIKGTEKGILVTRFWYTRWLDPQTLLYTGLTRDGTFYIDNGQIKHPIKNFRFNESPVIMLNNLEAIGIPERTRGCMVPPLRIRDFTFSSLSDAV
ncbi:MULTISPECIES: TldD/PmbA family protein [unclassified Spirosoma]|uniref:TldD/PmbA family protein n=1 Tax=unclassified Spirosoma TaxID=2621999 RepID=UPI0009691570|nr:MULTISPECIES: TldD/PmbA family protein [unclassified Spirosoma]MBN8822369.1 TldD/PmbA family protein [Spirosoma sp.]OJW72334.1 MAG: peptidase C69 [Spirosoma sp. 48-14]